MYYKLITVCVVMLGLCSCAKHGQQEANQSGPCTQIKQEMSRSYAPQIQRPTAIYRAKLLRDYEHYDCDQQ